MSTEATLTALTTTRHEASSTAWFWWKETRQLAPLVALLAIVSLLIIVINAILGVAMESFRFQLPHEVTMLVFPGLFATGAGPLLVGQERSQRTIDWLALLPISSKRLATTKLLVGMAGLAVMWAFALLVITAFDLGQRDTSHWTIGGQTGYSGNPFSYPVWISHSLFVLLAGFYVAWRIKNQFYSLIALIPLAFSPMIATSLISEFSDRPMATGPLDWINFGFTLLGIAIVTPITYRAAIRTLGAADAPAVTPLLDVAPHSPARETNDSIAPTFGTQTAPIIWQSIHSAKGMLAILIGMLLVSFLAAIQMAAVDRYRGIIGLLPWLLLMAPLAVCWLGISVFKHDGASERVRFLADRGVSPGKTYFALHAVPIAILCGSLLVYGLWNLTIIHREAVSDFAAGLPSLVTMLMIVVWIYAISQWVSQFVRTLILSVILAPILSLVTVGWLVFAYVSLGFPIYGLILCGLAPMVATYVMMRRYMDTSDRPLTFVVGGGVVGLIVLLPIGFATAHVLSVPAMDPTLRSELISEAQRDSVGNAPSAYLRMTGLMVDDSHRYDPFRDKMKELEGSLGRYNLDPLETVEPIRSRAGSKVIAHVGPHEYSRWHGNLMRARIQWRQTQDDQAWTELANWLDASAILLPALRRSSLLSDQEVADRLEVLLIDTLQHEVPVDRVDAAAVQTAMQAIGTPASRAAARRRAVVVTWQHKFQDDRGRYLNHNLTVLGHLPPGLVGWMQPRLYDSLVAAMLEGIDAAANRSDDIGWRLKLHQLHQTGGVFQASRYGDELRSMPAIETMILGNVNGYGQLWGRDWEYVELQIGKQP
ncbi:ABC-2 family transporter protein [Stieleria neptunia]|uniref:ABC-2 family transporter protein n=1 Tax=Stieleria neptunia TaxID=2527979 RepID=A0A518HKB4_9BACT|nr:ABC transporter permease [Stieleria neptunia]QDV41209.1 ABC-2 family transporter protein [Stieleria neptunia]